MAAALLVWASAVFAQPYPSKSIQFVVPFAAGSPADTLSRVVAQERSRALGQSVIVLNMTGAGGTIGTAELARSPPDGYTIGFASQGTLAFNQAIYAKPGYDSLKDFVPVALLTRTPNVLVVQPGNAASGPADIVADAKAAPGTLTFASGGSGTSHHVVGTLFARNTGISLVHVPYNGSVPAVLAVMTGEVSMGFFNTFAVIGPIREGRLKPLGVTSVQRLPMLPDVPTFDEQGIHGLDISTWAGIVAPGGTPTEIVLRLNAHLNRILSAEAMGKWLDSHGLERVPPLTPDEFAGLIAEDVAVWVPVVKAAGAKAY